MGRPRFAILFLSTQCEAFESSNTTEPATCDHDIDVYAGRNRTGRRPVAHNRSFHAASCTHVGRGYGYFMAHAPKNSFPLFNGATLQSSTGLSFCCSSLPDPAAGLLTAIRQVTLDFSTAAVDRRFLAIHRYNGTARS